FPLVSGVNTDTVGVKRAEISAPIPNIPTGAIPPELEVLESDPPEVAAEKRKRQNLLLLPDQSPLLPGSLQPTLKATHRYDRVEAQRASPDAMIQEIRRQEQTAMQGIDSLPDAQRAAAIAQIQANTQNELNKVMTNVEGLNMNAKAQADQYNAQIQG